jgi:hypothetical protein
MYESGAMSPAESQVQAEHQSESRTENPARTGRSAALAQVGLVAATVAAVAIVNLIVYGIARGAGVSVVVRTEGAAPHAVHAADVVVASIVPLLVGALLALALSRLWSPALRLAQVVGGGFAALSGFGPVLSQSDGGTKLTLVIMHTLVAVAVVAGLEAVRRRAGLKVT